MSQILKDAIYVYKFILLYEKTATFVLPPYPIDGNTLLNLKKIAVHLVPELTKLGYTVKW